MTDHKQDTRKRQAGGAAERLSWLVSNAKAVSPGAFRLLVVLADHAKRDGTAWPSWKRLKELTGAAADTTIMRQLDELKGTGLVALIHRGKGSRSVNHYQLSGAVHGWVSTCADASTEDEGYLAPPQGDTLRDGKLSTCADARGNKERTRTGGAEPNPPFLVNRENQPTQPAHPLKAGAGLVDSLGSDETNAADLAAEAEARAVKLQEAADAKAAADLAEWEAIWPCAGCGLEHWTDDLERHRKFVKRGGDESGTVCDGCKEGVRG